jgi:hypothetical protein
MTMVYVPVIFLLLSIKCFVFADLRNASVRHDRNGAGEEVLVSSRPNVAPDCPDCLCW